LARYSHFDIKEEETQKKREERSKNSSAMLIQSLRAKMEKGGKESLLHLLIITLQ
jgi:hypothetical protein